MAHAQNVCHNGHLRNIGIPNTLSGTMDAQSVRTYLIGVVGMYSLSDFTKYTGQRLTGESTVLIWSQKTGYFFSQYGFLSDFDCVRIVAIKF